MHTLEKMPYLFDSAGRLTVHKHRNYTQHVSSTNRNITADNIRTPHVYVESTHDIEPGHVVEWTGDPAMFTTLGKRQNTFDYNYAISSVRPATNYSHTVAGIVTEKAASPGSKFFTHKGIHTNHRLAPDVQHIYRIGRDVQMAWVLDDSFNEVEGIYQRYVNGQLDATGPYQLTMISNDVFAINRTIAASIEQELTQLKARFDALTT